MKKLCGIMIIFGLLFAVGCSCSIVNPGYVGIRVALTGDTKGQLEILENGWYIIGPTEQFFEFPLFRKAYSYSHSTHEGKAVDESVTFQTQEGLSVNADVGVNIRIEKAKVADVFRAYRSGIDEVIHSFLRNEVRDAFQKVAGAMPVESVYGSSKTKLLQDVTALVKQRFEPQGIQIDEIYLLTNFRLPDAVLNALNSKIQATQLAEKAENELRMTQAEAKKKVAHAEGEALANKARAEGEAAANRAKLSTINEQLLQYERMVNERMAIEKWNGTLPTFTGGGAIPFINVNK